MQEIIKNIEAAQLKENVPQFNVGDTVSRKVTANVSRFSKELFLRNRVEAHVLHSQ